MARKRRGVKATFIIGGEGVTPMTTDVRTLARDLLALDEAVRAMGNVPDDEMAVALTRIGEGSLQADLFIASPARAQTDTIVLRARSGRYDELPDITQTRLAQIASGHQGRGQTAALIVGGKKIDLTGKHRPKAKEPLPPVVGTTTIYGVVLGVLLQKGDAQVVLRRTDTGIKQQASASRLLAKKLASMLDEEVGVNGVATWDAVTLEVTHFRITRVSPYRPVASAVEAFDAARASGLFDDLDLSKLLEDDDGVAG